MSLPREPPAVMSFPRFQRERGAGLDDASGNPDSLSRDSLPGNLAAAGRSSLDGRPESRLGLSSSSSAHYQSLWLEQSRSALQRPKPGSRQLEEASNLIFSANVPCCFLVISLPVSRIFTRLLAQTLRRQPRFGRTKGRRDGCVIYFPNT